MGTRKRDEIMTILMGRWDCTSCSSKGVRGDVYRCHACGASRPENVTFYLPDEEEVVTDIAAIKAAEAGSDWKCNYCSQWVTVLEKQCPNCAGGTLGGATRQTVKEVNHETRKIINTQEEYSGGPPKVSTVTDRQPPRVPRPTSLNPRLQTVSTPSPVNVSRNTRQLGQLGLVLLASLGCLSLILGGLYALFHTTAVPAKLTHHSWVRTQHVEEFRRGIAESGWDHPADAYNISTSQRVHHHDRVVDHYVTVPEYSTRRVADGTERYKSGTRTVDLGNGRFRREPVYKTRTTYRTERYQSGTRREAVYRQVPVYRTYYTYLVNRWQPGQDRITQGQNIITVWPSIVPRDADQRMTGRAETYRIHFQELNPPSGSAARTWEQTLDEPRWRAWSDNTPVVLVVNAFGIQEIKQIE
jgi:hypothetical protein